MPIFSEQFDKSTGTPLSAIDLTWSYAAFLTTASARNNVVPSSWGASSANAVPSACTAASPPTASYTAATNTAWPNFPCTTSPSVSVTFNILSSTSPGQSVFVVGSTSELGTWDTSKALELSAEIYTNGLPLWLGTATLDSGAALQYKYFRTEQDGTVVWEEGDNRTYTVPTSCRSSAAVDDAWR